MKAVFWGVRGSIPTPGEDTNKWGGNSSCVEICHGDNPPLILDCGTGARALGNTLVARSHRNLDLLLTHYHMDHVIGFPFFSPIYTPGYDVRITSPAFSAEDAQNKLSQFLNGVYHPVRLRDVMSNLEFNPVRPGDTFDRGAYRITTCRMNHPGGAVAYRVSNGSQSIAYVTDTAPFAKPGEGVLHGHRSPMMEQQVISFLKGADVVIYDTMYARSEYLQKMTWGHSYPEYAHAICDAAGVGHLVLFHHSPDSTDDQLDALASQWASSRGPRVSLAKEGCAVNVEG